MCHPKSGSGFPLRCRGEKYIQDLSGEGPWILVFQIGEHNDAGSLIGCNDEGGAGSLLPAGVSYAGDFAVVVFAPAPAQGVTVLLSRLKA